MLTICKGQIAGVGFHKRQYGNRSAAKGEIVSSFKFQVSRFLFSASSA
jgi:hypothetical protein